MSRITTHVLDTARGLPAVGVPITLQVRVGDEWKTIGRGKTDADGRARELGHGDIEVGSYRLIFDTAAYFEATDVEGFFPVVQIEFDVRDAGRTHHVPLLLSPFGYSTYRGS